MATAGVSSVTISEEGEIPADMVIIGIGGKPNTEVAAKAGLRLIDDGSIWVDAYMRTSAPDVFAVGDCALKRDFFTRKAVPVWLASTATAEARNAGTNIYGIRVLNQLRGTIAAFSTKLGDTCFASAGMTEKACQKEGIRYVSGTATAPDRASGQPARRQAHDREAALCQSRRCAFGRPGFRRRERRGIDQRNRGWHPKGGHGARP